MFAISQKLGVLGTSFLAWSIHYLRGDKKYFLYESQNDIPLPNNPFNKFMAHRFTRNLVYDIEALKHFPNNSHCTFYTKSFNVEDISTKIQEFLNYCDSEKIKTIYIDTQGTEDTIGLISIRENLRDFTEQDAIKNKIKTLCPSFYSDQKTEKDLLNFMNPDDFTNRFKIKIPSSIYNLQFNRYVNDGVKIIREIFSYLQQDLIEENLNKWKTYFYPTWQHMVSPDYYFCSNIKEIAQKVYKKENIDLSKYNMNLLKETLLARVIKDEYNG